MLFGNRPADKTAKWRVSTRSFAVLLAYTLVIGWLEGLDLGMAFTCTTGNGVVACGNVDFMRCSHGGNRKI